MKSLPEAPHLLKVERAAQLFSILAPLPPPEGKMAQPRDPPPFNEWGPQPKDGANGVLAASHRRRISLMPHFFQGQG